MSRDYQGVSWARCDRPSVLQCLSGRMIPHAEDGNEGVGVMGRGDVDEGAFHVAKPRIVRSDARLRDGDACG